jgi:hypothetical protein
LQPDTKRDPRQRVTAGFSHGQSGQCEYTVRRSPINLDLDLSSIYRSEILRLRDSYGPLSTDIPKDAIADSESRMRTRRVTRTDPVAKE